MSFEAYDMGNATVAAERAGAPRTATLAIVAALLPVLAVVLATTVGAAPSSTVGLFPFYDQHGSMIIAGSVVSALGYITAAVPLIYLMQAAIARGRKVPRFAPMITIVAALLLSLGNIVFNISLVETSHRFVNESGITYQQTKDVFTELQKNPVGLAGLLGVFGFAFGFVMASLNAMRVGLLPKFLGWLGVLAGVMPLLTAMVGTAGASTTSIVQTVWLIAVGALIWGRWPNGLPEAWLDGEAHPWPSASAARAEANPDS